MPELFQSWGRMLLNTRRPPGGRLATSSPTSAASTGGSQRERTSTSSRGLKALIRKRAPQQNLGLLDRLDLRTSADRPFGEFSTGMKQRLAVARALAQTAAGAAHGRADAKHRSRHTRRTFGDWYARKSKLFVVALCWSRTKSRKRCRSALGLRSWQKGKSCSTLQPAAWSASPPISTDSLFPSVGSAPARLEQLRRVPGIRDVQSCVADRRRTGPRSDDRRRR